MKRFAILIALVMTAALALPAQAGGGAALLFSPTEKVDGMTLAEWHGAWQIWIQGIPKPINPERHPHNNQNCALQSSGMIFLASSTGNGDPVTCSIPADTPVGFTAPLATWECSTAEGLGETFEDLTRKCTGLFYRDISKRTFNLIITIDGELVRGDRRWVNTTPGEIVVFPENNLWGVEAGPSNSVSKGFFFLLRPLSVGTHTISAVAIDKVYGRFTADWTLEVV